MRVALVHDYLNQYGGGERVLEALSEIFPEAPIYTLFYDKIKTFNRFEGKVQGTSFLNRDMVIKNHRFFIPLMPLAASQLNLGSDYDLILSSSAGYAKASAITENLSIFLIAIRLSAMLGNIISILNGILFLNS